MLTKEHILISLRTWINQRPGLEFADYGNVPAYRSELRSITKDRRDALELLNAVALRGSITAEDLLAAFPRAFSGRLSITETTNSKGEKSAKLDYCTGQYWPTEYRRAVCAVLSAVLWAWMRDSAMPKPAYIVGGRSAWGTMQEAQEHAKQMLPAIVSIEERYNGKTAGDFLRSSFRREFGRSIAGRWFN